MKKIITAGIVAFTPVLTFAQQANAFTILERIGQIIGTIIPILIAAGVLYFIWGVIKYITAKDEEKQTEARTVMISGIIGLFVIISVWGLVRVIQTTFDVKNDGSQVTGGDIPCIPGSYDALGYQCPL